MNWEHWDTNQQPNCTLCHATGGPLIWQNDEIRIVLVDDPHFTGFTRVIWQHHVKEMTDLSAEQRQRFMDKVYLIEQLQREHLKPIKVNLASLGNITPHLHWHIIPRYEQDAAYPNPIWAITAEQTKTSSYNGVTTEHLDAYVRAIKIALWDQQ